MSSTITIKYRSIEQHRRLFGILAKLELKDDDRHALVRQYTDGRTDSSAKMYPSECEEMITHLQNEVGDRGHNMTMKVFSLAHQLGWEQPGGKVDMARLQGFIDTRGAAKKKFAAHSLKELRTLITQLEQVLASPKPKRNG